MPIPASEKRYSGYNYSNVNPVVGFLYDSSIDAFRPVSAADFAAGGGGATSGTSQVNITGAGRAFNIFDLPAVNSGDVLTFRFNKDNGALIVHQANLNANFDTVSVRLSGVNQVGITGLVAVSGQRTDAASGYNSGGLPFMNVGGRAVELSGWNPGYGSGSGSLLNFNRENGALLVQQTDLSKDIDSVTNYPVGGTFANTAVPSGVNGTCITGSSNLVMWGIQNLQTGRLWVKFGDGAHFTSFNMVLRGATSSGAADGGTLIDSEGKWRGNVSVSGEFNVQYNAWGIYA